MTDRASTSVAWEIDVGGLAIAVERDRATADAGRAATSPVIIFAHGAGSHRSHPLILRETLALREAGFDVVRFNFPYRERGDSRPDRMETLTTTFRAVAASLEKRGEMNRPDRLYLGGQSMGGRAASMLAAEGFGCAGLVLFAYPLHPPRDETKLRTAHLPKISCPALCMNGTRDPLCRRELMEQVLATLEDTFTMHWLEGADHGFRVLKRGGRTEEGVFSEITGAIRTWLPAPHRTVPERSRP